MLSGTDGLVYTSLMLWGVLFVGPVCRFYLLTDSSNTLGNGDRRE